MFSQPKKHYHYSLLPWAHAASMESYSRWWLQGGIWTWIGRWVPGWYILAILPPNIHLFSWLSWKVCIKCSPCCKVLILSSYRILLAGIWDKGLCPCPWCFVLKSDIYKLGQATDFASWVKKARTYIGDTIHGFCDFIYERGYGISSIVVEHILKPESWTTTLVRSCSNFEVCATS